MPRRMNVDVVASISLHGVQRAAARGEALGLLQPIVVTPDNVLIDGARRIEAMKSLGIDRLPAHVVDLDAIVLGEFDANEVRKSFTVSEKVAIGRAVEEKLGERRGRPKEDGEPDLLSGGDEKPRNCAEYYGKETREIAADRSGFSSKDAYEQAKTIVDRG